MAQYAYDFSLYNNGSAAPNVIPERERKTEPQPLKTPELRPLKKQREDVRKSEIESAKVIAKFFAGVVFCVVIFSVICSSFAAVKSAQYSKMKYESERNLLENSYLEKCAELNTLVTPDEIVRIAVEKLGMIKVSDENKLYANTDNENVILVSADK